MSRQKKSDLKKLLPLGIVFGIFSVLALFATYDLIKLIVYDYILESYSKPREFCMSHVVLAQNLK